MKHAPAGYACPFCGIAATLPPPAPASAVVLIDENVFALVPTHHYAGIKGNYLVIPRAHCENVLDIPGSLGTDFFRATRHAALGAGHAGRFPVRGHLHAPTQRACRQSGCVALSYARFPSVCR